MLWKYHGSVMSPVLNPANYVMKNNLSVSHVSLLALIQHHPLCPHRIMTECFVHGGPIGSIAITEVL